MTSSKESLYDITQWHQAYIISSGLQVSERRLTAHRHLAKTCCFMPKFWLITEKTFLRTFSEDSLHTCSPSNFWSAFFSLKWFQTALLWPVLKGYSCSINRRGHWRLKARVWTTKAFISQKQSISQSFSQSSSSTNISKLHKLSLYLFVSLSFWVCVCKSFMCWNIKINTKPITIQSVILVLKSIGLNSLR